MSDDDPAEEPKSPQQGTEAEPGGPGEPASAQGTPLASALEPPPDEGAVAAFEKRALLAEDRLAEVLAAYRKIKADNEGHRERISRNLERRYHQRRDCLLLKFIDILDNMDRALDAAETTYAGEPLIEGLILVRTQLLQTLQEEGLERVPVLGLPYDPNVAEAVETQLVAEPEQHHVVVKELLRGYRLNGRVARVSRVIVGQYSAEELAPPPPPGPPPEPPAPADGEPTLEEIVARAEAQEALFPGAFEEDDQEVPKK